MLHRALFLAARTPRSQAYAQAMAAAGLPLGHVLLCGAPRAQASAAPADVRDAGVALPDLSESLEVTCARAGWPTESVAGEDVNDPALAARVAALRPSCIVFSWFGGQIVRDGLLSLGIPMLHAHSGWLPRFRGSTTVYYSIIEERRCAVSVLQLARAIDAGPVLARAHYPLPPAGADVDAAYDSAIRADLLVRTLQQIAGAGALPAAVATAGEAARTYYVVHPVLKHLALLSLDGAGAARGTTEGAS